MLKIEDLSIGFGSGSQRLQAVSHVSLSLNKGQSLGLVGESGSGKSITALSIMKLLPVQASVTSGQILYQDIDILKSDFNAIRKLRGNRISMIFQEPMTTLNPVMRCGKQVAESIQLHQKVNAVAARKQVIALFDKVKLPRPESIYRSYPHEISGGQMQRVMIAMAVANKPELLIADEPTTALDVTVQKEIIHLLNDLKQEYGMSLLFISHDLALVSEIVDEVAVMFKGEIVESGKIKDVFHHPKHPYTKGLLACRPTLDKRLKKLPTVDEFMKNIGSHDILAQKAPLVDPQTRKQEHDLLYAQKPLLKIENLEKKFTLKKPLFTKSKNIVHAVNQVSFQVFPGETLGLVGESGCGKTTLGRSILRLIEPDLGRIFYNKVDILQLKPKSLKKARQQLNIVFQDPYSSLNPRMSIGQAIMEPMQVHKLLNGNKERKKRVFELLEKVGLEAYHFYRYPHEFSGGQRQRIVIARSLSLHPRFIICDEAVSALDVSVQAKVLNLLNDLKIEFGFTYIFISHDLSVVRFMSDRILVMKDGMIVESGDADEIYNHPKTEYTKHLIESIPAGV